MPFLTTPHFEDRQQIQYSGESITLSGVTKHSYQGQVIYQPTVLFENPTTGFTAVGGTGFTITYNTGQTQYTLAGLTGYQYPESFRPGGSGLIVQPPIRRVGYDIAMTGGTGTTTVDVTGMVLTAVDSGGTAMWASISSMSAGTNTYLSSAAINCTTNVLTLTRNDAVDINVDLTCIVSGSTSGGTDGFITGGTIDCATNTLFFNLNNGSNPSVDLSCLTFTGNTSGNCITDLWITNLHGCSPITVYDNLQNITSTASGNYVNVFGNNNISNSDYSFIGGGNNNVISAGTAFNSTITSGDGNRIFTDSISSIVGGGRNNIIIGGNYNSVLGGLNGYINGGARNTVIGGSDNRIQPKSLSFDNTIVSGYKNKISGGRRLLVGSGNDNIVGNSYGFLGYADYSTILNGKGNVVSGNTKGSVIVNGHDNTISHFSGYFTSGAKYSSIGGGGDNTVKTTNTVIGGGSGNSTGLNTGYGTNTFIGGGADNRIEAGYSSIVGGKDNLIDGQLFASDQKYSFIGGGKGNTLTTGSTYSSIMAGESNTITHSNSHIIGSNITSTDDNMTYVEGLTVTGDNWINSDTDRIVNLSSITSLFKGGITSFNTEFATGDVYDNSNVSGTTGVFFGNFNGFPTTTQYGSLTYHGSGYTRTGIPTTGTDFYRNKIVLKGHNDADGMVINPKANTNTAKLWFEINGKSMGILTADSTGGSGDGYWGFGMSKDGVEMPDATVQIGGTGTTGSFKYRDGNETSGYVLTSDSVGYATWQAPTGGGGVSIDPYEVVAGTSITWDVSGTSTNYQMTLTGNTILDLINVRNGDYGTLIATQDGVGSRTITFGGGTHRVVNGGGGSPTLTATALATDILSFTYNGSVFYWTVGNDYT